MKKTLLVLLAVLILLFAVGCGDTSSEQEGSSMQTSNIFENGCYYLADFENYDQITQITYKNSFGKIACSDQHVTHGQKSLRAEIFGYEIQWGRFARPYMSIPTGSAYFQKRDFSDCSCFELDIYSEMPYDVVITFTAGNIERNLTVSPGANTLEVLIADPDAVKDISEFRITFDRGEEHDVKQVYYLDSFRARKEVQQ